ncbi:MAG: hypothetical protein BHW37_06040 [Firmicutes bacterium CAG:272_52_7]|nr:MAG: hypothetical protein BHW37_06040 [Firmicutes bacterium CAG:272_52_7]
MYNNEMLESMKKVAAKRAENAALEPRRMTADEKDTLLATYHPDYKQNEFSVLEIGANKGEKVPTEQIMMQLYPEIYSCVGCNACTKACTQGLNVMQYIAYAHSVSETRTP